MANDPEELDRFRFFLKDTIRRSVDFSMTGQHLGVPPPPIEKPVPPGANIMRLPKPGEWSDVGPVDLTAAIAGRSSHRAFKPESLRLDSLAYLLWATQGIRHLASPFAAYRTVPSAGCRHAFETYLCVLRVEGLQKGIYRYLPVEHALLPVSANDGVGEELVGATLQQTFIGTAAVDFIWTTIPERMEWRYGLAAHKTIAIDAGHVCQNLYLAASAVGCGVCAVAAYDQALMDRLVQVDGSEEFVLYLAAVGRI